MKLTIKYAILVFLLPSFLEASDVERYYDEAKKLCKKEDYNRLLIYLNKAPKEARSHFYFYYFHAWMLYADNKIEAADYWRDVCIASMAVDKTDTATIDKIKNNLAIQRKSSVFSQRIAVFDVRFPDERVGGSRGESIQREKNELLEHNPPSFKLNELKRLDYGQSGHQIQNDR